MGELLQPCFAPHHLISVQLSQSGDCHACAALSSMLKASWAACTVQDHHCHGQSRQPSLLGVMSHQLKCRSAGSQQLAAWQSRPSLVPSCSAAHGAGAAQDAAQDAGRRRSRAGAASKGPSMQVVAEAITMPEHEAQLLPQVLCQLFADRFPSSTGVRWADAHAHRHFMHCSGSLTRHHSQHTAFAVLTQLPIQSLYSSCASCNAASLPSWHSSAV